MTGGSLRSIRVRRGDLQGVLAAEGRIAPWGPDVGPQQGERLDSSGMAQDPKSSLPGSASTMERTSL